MEKYKVNSYSLLQEEEYNPDLELAVLTTPVRPRNYCFNSLYVEAELWSRRAWTAYGSVIDQGVANATI